MSLHFRSSQKFSLNFFLGFCVGDAPRNKKHFMELHVLQPSTPNDSPRLWAAGSWKLFPEGWQVTSCACSWMASSRLWGRFLRKSAPHFFNYILQGTITYPTKRESRKIIDSKVRDEDMLVPQEGKGLLTTRQSFEWGFLKTILFDVLVALERPYFLCWG